MTATSECNQGLAEIPVGMGRFPEKPCRECQIVKSLDQFHKSGHTPDGLKSICKACHNAKYSSAARYRSPSSNRDRIAKFSEIEARKLQLKICERCGFIGPMKAWPKYDGSDNYLHHYRTVCASCNAAERQTSNRGRGVSDPRVCTKCKIEKPADCFLAYRTSGKQMRCGECHPCRKFTKREYRKGVLLAKFSADLRVGELLSARLAKLDARIALDCEHAAKEFRKRWTPRLLANTPGTAEYNEKNAARSRARYARDPEAGRLRQIRYKHANPTVVARWGHKRTQRAAIQSDGTLTREAVNGLFGAAPKRCPYCRASMPGSQKSLDHLDPISGGGLNGISNVAICCRRCNIRKGAMPFPEWLLSLSVDNAKVAARLYRRVRGCAVGQQSLALQWAAVA